MSGLSQGVVGVRAVSSTRDAGASAPRCRRTRRVQRRPGQAEAAPLVELVVGVGVALRIGAGVAARGEGHQHGVRRGLRAALRRAHQLRRRTASDTAAAELRRVHLVVDCAHAIASRCVDKSTAKGGQIEASGWTVVPRSRRGRREASGVDVRMRVRSTRKQSDEPRSASPAVSVADERPIGVHAYQRRGQLDSDASGSLAADEPLAVSSVVVIAGVDAASSTARGRCRWSATVHGKRTSELSPSLAMPSNAHRLDITA